MCELCEQPGGEIVFRDDRLRVVLVDEANFPGFCRVIWNAHVREMTDLSPDDRDYCMDVVWQVESAVRQVMRPHKINVASLGNVVPHVHWHVIPRFEDDTHFPAPVWAEAKRALDAGSLDARRARLELLRTAVAVELKSKKQTFTDGAA